MCSHCEDIDARQTHLSMRRSCCASLYRRRPPSQAGESSLNGLDRPEFFPRFCIGKQVEIATSSRFMGRFIGKLSKTLIGATPLRQRDPPRPWLFALLYSAELVLAHANVSGETWSRIAPNVCCAWKWSILAFDLSLPTRPTSVVAAPPFCRHLTANVK